MSQQSDTAEAALVGLPPPRRVPLASDDPALSRLTVFERRLLDDHRAGRPILLLVRTGSLADTGLWFRRARLFLACLDDRLLLFANGSRPHVETYPGAGLRGSLVNIITGELVLADTASLVPRRTIRLSLPDAYQVYAQIMAMEDTTAC